MDTKFRIARDEIRNEIRDNDGLISTLRIFARSNAGFYPGYGNLGDALIALGTFDLFGDIGWSPTIVRGRHAQAFDNHTHIVMGGGGGWVRGLWETYLEPVKHFLANGGHLLILPSSFAGFGSEFVPFAEQITVFCREEISRDELIRQGFPEARISLCHDLAFYTNPEHFSAYEQVGSYPDLRIYRQDEESVRETTPRDNVDFSLLFNDIQWSASEECLSPLCVAALLMSKFSRVETDRLHMTVLAALIGREVTMKPNSYFKNKGVYDYTLARFPNVSFMTHQSLRSLRDLGRDAELRLLRDTLTHTRLALQIEKESHSRTLRQNDALLQRENALPERVIRSQLEDEIFKRDIELRVLKSSKIYRLQKTYYSVYDIPVIGSLLKAIRRSIAGSR